MRLIMTALLLSMPLNLYAIETEPKSSLESFGPGFDEARLTARDSKVIRRTAGQAGTLRIECEANKDWPAVLIAPPGARGSVWDLSRFTWVSFDVMNAGTAPVEAKVRIDSRKSDGEHNCNYGSIELAPGQRDTLRVNLIRKARFINGKVEFFGMLGTPFSTESGINAAQVTSIQLFLERQAVPGILELHEISVGGNHGPGGIEKVDVVKFMPFIDEFGQYIHRDWPGKCRSEDDMRARNASEDAELATHPVPGGRDKWGGWSAGPVLTSTGFFRPEKFGGKWWLVDPDGRLFWSHGIDGLWPWSGTAVEEREEWFRGLPPREGQYAGCWFEKQTQGLVAQHYGDKKVLIFNFGVANAMRKYGEGWEKTFIDVTHRRLKSWGFNTIGNWSDWELRAERLTPYTVAIDYQSPEIPGSKFKDTFHPDFRMNLQAALSRQRGKSAGDPWCIGYFIDNELPFPRGVEVAMGALRGDRDMPAKQAFVADLKARYGEIARLNAKWGMSWKSWDALLDGHETPEEKRAMDDLDAFTARVYNEYFKVCREEMKAIAPDNLYLGCRFAWEGPKHAEQAAAKYADIVSYNRYSRSPEGFKVKYVEDKPILIGEFHFGALDRGMFHGGLVPVANQAERATAYVAYVKGALSDPRIVGAHYFAYMDQPTTGRFDGENCQIGFIDICGTPYPEIVSAARDIGKMMYGLRTGR